MISWFFLTKFTNNHRFIISILIFAINVIGKMHELTEEAMRKIVYQVVLVLGT